MSDHEAARIRRVRRIARLAGAVVGMVAGVLYGTYIVAHSNGLLTENRAVALAAVLAAGAAAASALALALPLVTIDPYVWLRDALERAPAAEVAGAVAGLGVALMISALVAVLLGGVPWGLGAVISLGLACALVNVGVGVGRRRGLAFAALALQRSRVAVAQPVEQGAATHPDLQEGLPILVDTSALIDGRVVDVARTGFIQGRLLIPRFVLEELQRVADSSSEVRRARGRRGLEVVGLLRRGEDAACEVIEGDPDTGDDVDRRLVSCSLRRTAALMTVDYNLDRVARLAGVRVLNLNDLAVSLKPAVSAGETLTVVILKDGREAGQGIGYLDDGTMVIVENGRARRGESVAVTVSSVLQTSSGRMVFAAAGDEDAHPADSHRQVSPPSAAARH
ncbi:MAG: PIN/TRAM domain-containing protein [Candidatus Dormibacteria bacterium]